LRSLEQLDDYLGWTLTSGVREGSVDPSGLTEAFASQMNKESFLSKFYGDVPITQGLISTRHSSRLRFPTAQRFPADSESRVSHAFWYSYLAPKELSWPLSLVSVVRDYFEGSSSVEIDGITISKAVLAPREVRHDLRDTFPLESAHSIYAYIHWLVVHGPTELGLSLDEFAEDLYEHLCSADPLDAKLTRFARLVWEVRDDVNVLFDLSSDQGRAGYVAWFAENCAVDYPNVSPRLLSGTASQTSRVCRPDDISIKVAVVLTGQWLAKSGRGEDLRMSAASLSAVGYKDFVILDIDTGERMSSDLRVLDKFTKVDAEINIVHANADTAFPDWRRMQQFGLKSRKTIGFWAWELESTPSFWNYAYSFYDEIWASTAFARNAFQTANLRPVRLMPMAVVTPSSNRTLTRRELDLPENALVFFFMFDFRSF
jgi:hypothetical protein